METSSPSKHGILHSFNWTRSVGLSLSVLCTGLAIAYGGFFLGNKYPKPLVSPLTSPTPSPRSLPSPTASPAAQLYINTAYGYSLTYPSDLFLSANGQHVTIQTAPDVTFSTSASESASNPLRVFHVSVKEKNLLTSTGQPISFYTPEELASLDFQATTHNKNIYIATLAGVSKLSSLPKNISAGYTFSVQANGYQTITDGVLWKTSSYVITELQSTTYLYIIAYSATDEMKNIFASMQFSK